MPTQQTIVKEMLINSEALLVAGTGEHGGKILASDTAVSLWGGVDPTSGNIIDHYHPLNGENWDGRVLVIPHGRGSCTGSAVLLEAIHASHAPALILLNRPDPVIGLGAIVAEEVLHQTLPVAVLDDATFAMALQAQQARLSPSGVLTLIGDDTLNVASDEVMAHAAPSVALVLSAKDKRLLAGDAGPAAQVCMRIIQRMGELQGADRLVDVTRVHIDGCIYTGPAGLAFAQQLADWQGKVVVPTTLNAISIDRRHWRELGVPESQAQPADQLAEAYGRLGAHPTYTCAPYLLDGAPAVGEYIAWAESNAVVFANSVLGARTGKTPDLLDACAALTGRVPLAGYYLDSERRARIVVELPTIDTVDDALYPLLGHVIGSWADACVPAIIGLEQGWTRDALKAFGAAFATTSSAGMFHIVGVTPEAETLAAALAGYPPEDYLQLTYKDLQAAWMEFNDTPQNEVDLVALGNPHFSLEEFAALAALCAGRRKHATVDIVVTTSRYTSERAARAGYLDNIEQFGVRLITDTCWCMLQQPVISPSTQVIVTNSAKYAHYGPGLVKRTVRFAGLSDCVDAAITRRLSTNLPRWLAA